MENNLKVEVVGDVDEKSFNNNFYESLLTFLLKLHRQDKS